MRIELTENNVQKCRQRAGSAANDRADRINEALNREALGHGNGEPLAADSYDDYPTQEELSNPNAADVLETLATHDLIGGVDDLVSELTGVSDNLLLSKWIKSVEKALDLFSIDITEAAEQEDLLPAVLGYEPANVLVENAAPMLVAELYILGLRTSEIEDVFENADTHVSESDVRDSLKTVGLLAGKTRQEKSDSRGKRFTNVQPAAEPMDIQ